MGNRVVWAGRYAVFDELASGGMASVYLACRLGPLGDPPTSRVVAVKKMFEQFAKQPQFVTMFLDEAHVAARIRHPNVVNTYEFLRVPDSLAIVMEFVLSASLLDLVEIGRDRNRIAPIGVSAAILRDTLDGLHAAHETKDEHGNPFGLVHRDMSPHNILVGKDGTARVIDFGIAKAAGRLQVTEVGVMKGKYDYMAPEQIRAGRVDRRVDVYSAGIVLWEALTGRTLFGETSGDATAFGERAAGKVTAPAPSSVNPDVSPDLDWVVERALESDPAKRFPTTKEMREALEEATSLASPEQVAKWVESLAGSKLRELEAKRNEVETAYACGELSDLIPSGPSSSPAAVKGPASAPSSAPRKISSSASTMVEIPAPPPPTPAPAPLAPDLVVPDLIPQAATSKPDVNSSREPVSSSKRATPAPANIAFDDAFADADVPDVQLDLVVPRPSSPRLSSPSLDSRRSYVPVSELAPSLASRSSRRSGRGSGLIALLVLVVALAGAAVLFGPSFVRGAVLAGAARRGLVLSVDSIGLRSGGLALSGVAITLADVKDFTVKAPEVEVGLDWEGNVQKIFAPGYEITLRGNASDLGTHLTAWRNAAHAPLALDAKAGHLIWSDAFVPMAQLEAIDVSASFGAESEGSVHLETPSLRLAVARGSLGPWRARLDIASDELKVGVELDRSRMGGPPNVAFVAQPKLGTVLSIAIPRTNASHIGVPSDFLSAGADPELELAFQCQVLPTGEPVTAHAKLTMFAVSSPAWSSSGTPVDVVLEGAIGGDTSHMLSIDSGSATIGKVTSRAKGRVVVEHERILVEVDPPSGFSIAPTSAWTLDTRDFTAPTQAVAPAKPAPVATPAPSAPRRHK